MVYLKEEQLIWIEQRTNNRALFIRRAIDEAIGKQVDWSDKMVIRKTQTLIIDGGNEEESPEKREQERIKYIQKYKDRLQSIPELWAEIQELYNTDKRKLSKNKLIEYVNLYRDKNIMVGTSNIKDILLEEKR